MGHPEKAFQNMHDEFHRCEIVIQQKHLIQRRALSFGFGFQQYIAVGPAVAGFVVICHELDICRTHRVSRVE